MDKKIDRKLKSLLDYQKFEDDPKLNQVLKDSLKEDSSVLSELDLNNVTAGSYIRTAIYCKYCGGDRTMIHLIDTSTNTEYYRCYKCGHNEEIHHDK